MLNDAPSLPYYNPDDELIVENYACENGIGSVHWTNCLHKSLTVFC